MAVLQSQKQDISVLAGQTLFEQFDFFQDDALTVPFNLTGYTLQVVIQPPTLGEDATVTIGPAIDAVNGTVQIQCDTTGWKVGRGSWYMKATDSDINISYPLRGVLYVGNP